MLDPIFQIKEYTAGWIPELESILRKIIGMADRGMEKASLWSCVSSPRKLALGHEKVPISVI